MEKEIKTTDNRAALNRLTKYIDTINKHSRVHKNTDKGKGGRK
jgi:hypothetical protein